MNCIYFFDDNGCFTYLQKYIKNLRGCNAVMLTFLPRRLKCEGAAMIAPHHALSEKMRRLGNMPLITLGTTDKATLSLSSSQKERLMVSLQRSIKSFGGKVYEPCEFMLYTKTSQPLAAMAQLAAALLTDSIDDCTKPIFLP